MKQIQLAVRVGLELDFPFVNGRCHFQKYLQHICNKKNLWIVANPIVGVIVEYRTGMLTAQELKHSMNSYFFVTFSFCFAFLFLFSSFFKGKLGFGSGLGMA